MSRIGKRTIPIPSGTDVSVVGGVITVKGKGGTLTRTIHSAIEASVSNGEVSVKPVRDNRLARALWGTYAAHIRNMIQGVNQPFQKKLIVEGIGYRVEVAGKKLKLMVGFSHPVEVEIPAGITAQVDKNVVTIAGADKGDVGEFSAQVRAIKKPEPYKGKGIRYDNEVIRRKQGKKAAAAAA